MMNQVLEIGRILCRFAKLIICSTILLSGLPILVPSISIASFIGFALLLQCACAALGLTILKSLFSTYFACRSSLDHRFSSRIKALMLPVDENLKPVDALLLLREARQRILLDPGDLQLPAGNKTSSDPLVSTRVHESYEPNPTGSSESDHQTEDPIKVSNCGNEDLFDEDLDLEQEQQYFNSAAGDSLPVENDSPGVDSSFSRCLALTKGGELGFPIAETDALECMKIVELCISQADEYERGCSSDDEDPLQLQVDDPGYLDPEDCVIKQEVISWRLSSSSSSDCSSSSNVGSSSSAALGNSGEVSGSTPGFSGRRLSLSSLEDGSTPVSKSRKMMSLSWSDDTSSGLRSWSSRSLSEGCSSRTSENSTEPGEVSVNMSRGASRHQGSLKTDQSTSTSSTKQAGGFVKSLCSEEIVCHLGPGLDDASTPSSVGDNILNKSSAVEKRLQGFGIELDEEERRFLSSEELSSGGSSNIQDFEELDIADLNRFQRLLRFWREKERSSHTRKNLFNTLSIE